MNNKNKRINPYPIHSPGSTATTTTALLSSTNLKIFAGRPLWCGNSAVLTQTEYSAGISKPEQNPTCYFNHIIGLPIKNNVEHPIYDYEIEIQEAIENNQHVWIKKARGIGATEFLIRFLSWKALSTNELDYKSVFIIAGTREEFANEIKERMERLFQNEYPNVIKDSKHTECYINNTKFKVFPTKRLKDVRGYIDVAYLFIDEADFFDKKEQEELKYVLKSYEEKSKGKIILVSTAGQSGGLFETIENDPNSDFKKVFMLVNKGRGKIFDDKFLDEQKEKDPAFYSREYEGRYGFGMGNVFLYDEIEKCCSLFQEVKINHNCSISCGLDPGFGSSKFGITILQLEDNILRVIFAKEWDKASYEQMLFEVSRLKTVYRPGKIYVDASKPDFIKSLKGLFHEQQDYRKVIEKAKHDKIPYYKRMYVVPISFNELGVELLGRFQHFVSKSWFALSNIEHKELVTQMRQARFKENGNLDKEETGSNTFDVFDSTRLCLMPFHTGSKYLDGY